MQRKKYKGNEMQGTLGTKSLKIYKRVVKNSPFLKSPPNSFQTKPNHSGNIFWTGLEKNRENEDTKEAGAQKFHLKMS